MASAQLAHKTQRSKFCLAPSGHGWGMRTGKSAVLGCVPLIAQPFVVQPYEMLLPYEAFSKRVAFEQIPQVPRIVNVSDEEVREMRRRLVRVRRAFVWRVEGGGLAYNHTLLHLCHRALELRGALKAGPGADCSPLAEGLPDSSPTQRMPTWFPPPLADATRRLREERRTAMARLAARKPTWPRPKAAAKQSQPRGADEKETLDAYLNAWLSHEFWLNFLSGNAAALTAARYDWV